MKKFLSILLSFSIIFTSVSTVSALDIELPKNLDNFTEDVADLINEYEDLSSSESAVFFTAADESETENSESTNRLIVKSTEKIDTLNAINSVSGYNDLYILQFENSEDCEAALEYYSTLSCVKYVQEDGIDIINLSLSKQGESEVIHEAVQNAYNAGITVVAAAGNDGADLDFTFYSPACYDEVICVVSIDVNKCYGTLDR